MQVTADHAEQWAMKFETYDRPKLVTLLESSFAAHAPSWTPRRRQAEEILLLIQLPDAFPKMFAGRVRALSVALRLGEWVTAWAGEQMTLQRQRLEQERAAGKMADVG